MKQEMEIYRIVDNDTDSEVDVYKPPSAHDECNFDSICDARRSNCHGVYRNKKKYRIRKYKLVLVDDDCDPITQEEIQKEKEIEEMLRKSVSSCCYCDGDINQSNIVIEDIFEAAEAKCPHCGKIIAYISDKYEVITYETHIVAINLFNGLYGSDDALTKRLFERYGNITKGDEKNGI